MAGTRAKTQPIGSSEWIQNEREQTSQFVDQDVEEFGFSVRNELEWLNEHMADVFARNNVTMADVFKTPGKLRGKTPRTARKRDALGTRQPLTDIFAPNEQPPQPAQRTPFLDKVHQFAIAEDVENQPAARPLSRSKSPQRVGKPGNTDSGYHGMTDDEMDVDNRTETATDYSSQQSMGQKVPLRQNQGPAQRIPETVVEAGDTSGESFMSAKEDLTSKTASKERLREVAQAADAMEVDQPEKENDIEMVEDENVAMVEDENVEIVESENVNMIENDDVGVAETQHEVEVMDEGQDVPDESVTSDVSSPEKAIQRKSSFAFAALPPRDTFGAKQSIGARNSQIGGPNARASTLGRSHGTKNTDTAQEDLDANDHLQERAEESRLHSKTSTQLLQERINLLGKTKEPRPSKSIAQPVPYAVPAYPQLPNDMENEPTAPVEDDDDDDWIAPSKPLQKPAEKELSPARPPMHQKSISTTAIPSPRPNMDTETRNQKAVSVSNPNFAYAEGQMSTTPAGSPSAKKQHDGPMSASKSRLYSVLKSAKSLFASSASASAAAKLEAHNTPSKSPKRQPSNESKTAAVLNMPGAMYSEKQFPDPPKSPTRSMISLVSKSPSRKTRSSSENEKKREKEMKAQQKANDELEKAREKERQKAAKQQEKNQVEAAKREKELPRPPTAESEQNVEVEQPAQQQRQQPKSMLPPGKALRAPGPGRLAKPTRLENQQPPRPAVIRVTSQAQRMGQASTSNFSRSQHENGTSSRPTTAGSTRSGSAQANVRGGSAQPPNRVKALEAATRKKEADERAAQKKLEQKREIERKRAAKAEEERRAEEERKAAEQLRQQEAKLAAQRQAEKQALEQRRKEEARLDAQRRQDEAQRARAAQELAEAIKRERAQEAQKAPRADVGGTLRQLANKHTVVESAQQRIPSVNPAKPAKRVWSNEEDEPIQQQHHQPPPQRPGVQRGPPSYQQHDAKRRRTNEEEPAQQNPSRNSVMAPPMRPSAMRKDSNLSKFPHGYAHAPPTAQHNPHAGGLAQSMFKQAVTAQHHMQHPSQKQGMPNHPSQTVSVSHAPIPFAQHHAYQDSSHPPPVPNKYKTPSRPAAIPKSAAVSAAKSSPLYPNGDAIALPEIQTDSEDEDSDSDSGENTGAFRAPSWVASPALRDLLTQQQLVDPETVFGPIGELKMDEVFKGAKNQERLRRFRDRGSSAAWVESGDAVTSAEKRRDMEVRERVVREGGWRYEPGV